MSDWQVKLRKTGRGLWQWLTAPVRPVRRPAPACSSEDMLRQEYAHVLGKPEWKDSKDTLPELIQTLQTDDGDHRPVALCLSGGGIRSATFSLGVLQWLAGKDRLKHFHYLSTVSGGGYIGSFLVNSFRQAYLKPSQELRDEREAPVQQQRDRLDAKIRVLARGIRIAAVRTSLRELIRERQRIDLELARIQAEIEEATAAQARESLRELMHRLGNSAGTEHAAGVAGANRISGDAKDPIAPLRAYSNYLSPTGGLSTDAFALAAIFLRNLLLNLAVWLPLLAAAVALPRLYIAMLVGGPALNPQSWYEWWPTWAALLAIALGIGYIVADLPAPRWRKPSQPALKKAPTPPSNRFNPACFLPITAAAVVLSLLGAWTEPLHKLDWLWFAFGGALAHGLGIAVGLPLRRLRKIGWRPPSYAGGVIVLIVGAVGGVLASLVMSLLGQGMVALQLTPMQELLYASLSVPALTGAFWLAMTLHAGLMGRASSEEDREWWARATAAWLKFALIWVAVFAVTVWAPLLVLEYAAESGLTAVKFGLGGSALGVVTALIGYWSKHGDQVKSKAKGFLSATGVKLLDVMASAVLLAVLLSLSLMWNVVLDRCGNWGWAQALCSFDVHAQTDLLREQAKLSVAAASVASSDAVRVLAPEPDPLSAEIAELGAAAGTQVFAHVLLNGSGWMLAVTMAVLVTIAAVMAWRIGANQFSLHGMYGNRLVRAYLGSGRSGRHPHWFTGFDPDDNPKLADLRAPLRGDDGHPRLFPLLNLALNLVKPSEKRLDWQQRKAASFFATPLHCGAFHLGFRNTRHYAGGMSLGRAMTISGAAASPNMGYHSSPLVTAVMTLFNVRLGWWLPNTKINPDWRNEQPALGLDIMLAEAGGATGDEDNFVYLSDGGHFDNTGLYEMVRRRCRHIVVVDGTCDGEFKWSDLLDTVRKIRVDFGVPIQLHGELPGAGRKPDSPRCLKGTIQYSARDAGIHDGELIVLKPLLLVSDPPELAAYARDSAKEGTPPDDPNRFPHQSTADQYYDEQQFESYRLLGWLTADAALSNAPPPPPPKPRRLRAPCTLAALAATARGEGASPAEAAALVRGAGDLARAGVGGAGQLVQQMGTSVALATALTVGGTLGVVGTVVMKPSEVSLSEQDRALLKGGVKVKAEGLDIKLDPGAKATLDAGIAIQGGGDLSKAAQELSEAAAALKAAVKPGSASKGGETLSLDPKVIELLQDLQASIKVLKPTGPASPQPADLVTAINNLQLSLARFPEKEKMDAALTGPITRIETALKNLGPRQNIRGQEGAQR